MPGARDVEAVKGKERVKKSFANKKAGPKVLLSFNETIFVLFISERIYLPGGYSR